VKTEGAEKKSSQGNEEAKNPIGLIKRNVSLGGNRAKKGLPGNKTHKKKLEGSIDP
jgi:hypothetical protein